MSTMESFDAIVIGSGQGGVPLARYLADSGRATMLVESRHIGGTCINYGCTPTKTMVASARVAHVVRRAEDFGVRAEIAGVSMEEVRERKRSIVSSFREGSEQRIEHTKNLSLFRGEATFASPGRIQITNPDGTAFLTAERIFLNTGSRPSVPTIPGLDEVEFLTNESMLELDMTPEHLVIVGGGYVGVEFGQMFRRFGSAVTIVQRGRRLLPREDDDIAAGVASILADDGISVILDAEVVSVSSSGGKIVLRVQTEGSSREITGSHLLLAAGRTPNTESLNLEAAGIATDEHGYVRVNDRLETGVEGVWALGDVKGGPAFTHISYDDFRIIRQNLDGDDAGTTNGRIVPYTVFIDPQLGGVGMTEREARATGRPIRVASMPMSYVTRALETGESIGMIKAVVDAQTDRILGFAMLGSQAGEIAGAIQIAMMADLPFTVLRDAPFAHPTLMESLNNLFASWRDA